MGNPLVPQGVLNRVKAALTWDALPAFNITAPYLGRNGISMSPEGPATNWLPTMTGAVQSQEVYQKMTMTAHLLRTQQLADLYKTRMETDSNMGGGIIRPDTVAGGISPYQITNCGIQNVNAFVFNGTEEGFTIMFGGYYIINSNLFN